MAEENDVLESWEELDDKEMHFLPFEVSIATNVVGALQSVENGPFLHVLDKKLQDIKIDETVKNGTTESLGTMREEGNRTQYMPQVRILKRSKEDNDGIDTVKSRSQMPPQKTLEQREAEYQEARLRILGENYIPGADNCNNSATVSENKPIKLVKSSENLRLQANNKVQLLREPKGPDGTAGFDLQR